MEVEKDLKDIVQNLKKLRDSIYENDVLDKSTQKQQESFHKILKTLIIKTKAYMDTFNSLEHVRNTLDDLERMNASINSDDIDFYINTFVERLDWYYDYERKAEDGNFIAAADVVILWPLRAIAESLYRNLYDKKFDERFDKLLEQEEM